MFASFVSMRTQGRNVELAYNVFTKRPYNEGVSWEADCEQEAGEIDYLNESESTVGKKPICIMDSEIPLCRWLDLSVRLQLV